MIWSQLFVIVLSKSSLSGGVWPICEAEANDPRLLISTSREPLHGTSGLNTGRWSMRGWQ